MNDQNNMGNQYNMGNQSNYDQQYSAYAAPVTPQSPVAEQEPTTDKSKILLVVIIVILLAIIALLFFNKKESYAVVFVNEEKVEAVVVQKDETVTEKIINDANFLGWYYGSTKYDFSTKVTSNVVLQAQWKKETKTYSVMFDTDGGSAISAIQVTENEKCLQPTVPTKRGYDFVEWQLNGVAYDFTKVVTADIELKAIWKRNATEINYVVKFDTDGGNSLTDVTVAENGKLVKPANPTKTGYTFKEWQLNGTTYNFATIVTSDITLKAIWIAKDELTITFNSDGGSSVTEMKVFKGDKLGTLPKNPTKTGYTFGGWYNGTTKYTTSTVINSSITLKAKWLTADELALGNAKTAIKSSYNITKGGQAITVTSTGCTIVNTNASVIEKITRGISDTNKTLEFNITCGAVTGTDTAKGIIKASTLKYTAVANANEQNYNVKVFDGSTEKNGYKLYSVVDKSSTGGKTAGSLLASHVVSDGYAAVNNADIAGYPQFQLQFNDDANTVYVVAKK